MIKLTEEEMIKLNLNILDHTWKEKYSDTSANE